MSGGPHASQMYRCQQPAKFNAGAMVHAILIRLSTPRCGNSHLMSIGMPGLDGRQNTYDKHARGGQSLKGRTATDLPVPRSPMMRTPPMDGSMTLSSSASFISSCPASRTNGNAAVRRARFTAGTTSAGAGGAAVAALMTATPREATALRCGGKYAAAVASTLLLSPLLP